MQRQSGDETNCSPIHRTCQRRSLLSRLPISARRDQLFGVAVLPFSAEPAHGRRVAGARAYETVRRWSASFRLGIARRIRSTALAGGDKWHLDEVVVTINGKKHWLWRAVDQHGEVLDVLVQSRRKQGLGAERGTSAAQRTEQPG